MSTKNRKPLESKPKPEKSAFSSSQSKKSSFISLQKSTRRKKKEEKRRKKREREGKKKGKKREREKRGRKGEREKKTSGYAENIWKKDRPEDAYVRVIWSVTQDYVDPPHNEDAIWSLPLQQKMIRKYPSVKDDLPSDAENEASGWKNE
ncbi:hypothetical protein Tco_0407951 [Tanacetum coccineum]